MSPKQGRRRTTGKGGSARRQPDPAATRRLGLLVFGVVFVVLFAVVAIAEGLGDPDVSSGEVAVIEDAPEGMGTITQEDFDRSFEQAAAQTGAKEPPKPGDKQYEEIKETALSSLLDMIWIQGEAEERGVTVSDKEVADELKKLKKENFKDEAEYKKFLTDSGYTQQDVNERVKLQVIGTEIQDEINNSAPKPSQEQIEDYYEAAKSTQFTQPATRDVRLIVNKDKAKAEEAIDLLEKDSSASNWKKVAEGFSEDQLTKGKGGLQKGIAEGAFEEPLNEAIFDAAEKTVEGPVKSATGFNVFMVEGSTDEEVSELSEVETQIKSQLEQQAQQDTFGSFINSYTSRWAARTFCAEDFTSERCANFKPDGRPATAPPGCYEEDPKDGRPEACPAPVFQLIPAVPGSVTPVEPRGKPLPQRPVPSGEAAAETPEIPGAITP
jgi:parvulin-like peptidyl-prolyl isomerase